MKRVLLTAAMCLVLFNNYLYAGVSWIANRSFEYDGFVSNIGNQTPTGWDEVDIPFNFGGQITSDWAVNGNYSLNLFSIFGLSFNSGEMGTISQNVYLEDVNEIFFSLNLSTLTGGDWDSANRSFIVKIDDDVVWTSDALGAGDISGIYDGVVDLTGVPTYRDSASHLLTLGLRSNVTEAVALEEYYAEVDFLRFDTHCLGYGYLNSDFNHDCIVNFIDYGMFANHWMLEVEDFNMYDLDPNNHIDSNDLEILFSEWLGDSNGIEDDYIASDFNFDGIVNFVDYAMLDFSGYSDPNNMPGNISTLLEQWLTRNWMFGVE
ncbi:MAG: hypothetical protein ACYSSP_04825 [Planctomycetota bacterium]|jgi:hypothetical protein